MEYLESPYTARELRSEAFMANNNFLTSLEKSVGGHAVFDHPFLLKLADNEYSREGVIFVLKQFGKIVMPFTAAICKLMGNAPDVKSRFMLMDNLYEEMGGNNINHCHPILYLKMLDSIGVSKNDLDNTPTISSIRILNDAIYDAVANKSFAIGCAWLGYGGELTIPNNFPYLVDGTKACFGKDVDLDFWGRHGERDQTHSDDATTVLSMNTTPEEHDEIAQSVKDSLNIRAMIWDELEKICDTEYPNNLIITGKEAGLLSPEIKVLSEYYHALNNGDIQLMKHNWSKEKSAAFTSPLGGIVRTHETIISAHNELFESPIDIDVEYYDVQIALMDNGFQAVGRERGVMRIGNETVSVGFRTSRLFIKEDGEYKQLHHHGSFEDAQIQNKVLDTLSALQSA